jgi:hypothetical protein
LTFAQNSGIVADMTNDHLDEIEIRLSEDIGICNVPLAETAFNTGMTEAAALEAMFDIEKMGWGVVLRPDLFLIANKRPLPGGPIGDDERAILLLLAEETLAVKRNNEI